MATTYTLISSTTLGSNTTSDVTFSSIPQTYTDLLFRVSLRKSGGTSATYRINGVSTGTLYSYSQMQGEDLSALSERGSNLNLDYFSAVDSGYGANTFGDAEIYIPSYTASQNRQLMITSARPNTVTTQPMAIAAWAGLFRSTTAITSFSFVTQGDTYIAGSTFYLYGIKNS